MAQVIVKHGGAAGNPQGNALSEGGGHAGADGTPGAHKHIHLLLELGNHQIQPLQTGGGAHEIAMVKGEHHGVAADRVKNVRQVTLHTPVGIVSTLYMEAALIAKRNIRVVILCNLQSVFICHWNQSSFLKMVRENRCSYRGARAASCRCFCHQRRSPEGFLLVG